MSQKEPAIGLLRERYKESFAFTSGEGGKQIHLFLIKVGLWSLVYTIVPKTLGAESNSSITITDALNLVEDALSGRNPDLLAVLDESVSKAQARIKKKVDQFGSTSHRGFPGGSSSSSSPPPL